MENKEFSKFQTPSEYLKVFFRRKWLFISPVFVALVIGIVSCFLLPRGYESYTVILVQEEKLINPLIQGLAVSTNITQRMQTIREQLLGWNSLVSLTKKLNLAKDAKTQLDFERLILGIRDNIRVQMFGPMLIRIAYQGRDPQKTQQVAQTLTDILIEENMRTQTKEADVAIEFIKEQLEVYKHKIKESEIAQMEEQLKNLLHDSTDEHPMVKDLRQKIASAKKELESGEFKPPQGKSPIASATYETLQKELDKIINQEAESPDSLAFALGDDADKDPNTTIYKLMLMDKLDAVQARDMDVNEHIYNMLLQKLETAKITQRLESSKQGTRYTIIDPARLPLLPVKPNKLKVMLLSLFFGCVAGGGLAFGREFLDQSFLDIEDAKESLDLPVLGAISRLTTQEEIEKEILRKKKIITISLSSSALLIIIVMLIALLRR